MHAALSTTRDGRTRMELISKTRRIEFGSAKPARAGTKPTETTPNID
jgi:hypothetical protein